MKIESLGIRKIDVYDIEVDCNHNFFGNKILLHNSNYISLEEIIDKLKLKFNDNKEYYDWSKKFIEEVIKPVINISMSIYEKTFDQQFKIELQLEKIIKSAFVTGKKHYVLDIIEDEGKYYDIPKFSNTGIETKKRNTPLFVKDTLTEVLKMILRDEDKQSILKYMREQRSKYESLDIRKISVSGNISDYDKYSNGIDITKTPINYIKGTPKRNKAAINYNKVLIDLNITNLPKIGNKMPMNFVPVKNNNKYHVSEIGFIGSYPELFKEIFKIDYELLWEKSCIGLLTKWFDVLGYGEVILQENTFDDYF